MTTSYDTAPQTGDGPERDPIDGADGSDDSTPEIREQKASQGPRLIPIQGVAQRLASRMSESLAVPTATSFREIDAGLLQAERARLNGSISPRKLSITHLIAFAVAQAVAVHPNMASFYAEVDGRPHRGLPRPVGLGLAVDVEQRDGSRMLTVPVIHGADDMPFLDFVAAYDRLVDLARSGRLTLDDISGGTVTLTNPGTVGTTASVPRLMAGQGTIVATGAIRRAGNQSVMTVGSTYDHRIIQGAESGEFLRTIDELLQGAEGFYEYIAASYGLTGEEWQRPAVVPASAPAAPWAPAASPAIGPSVAASATAAAAALVQAIRSRGHRAAQLDPLGSAPPGDPQLEPATWGLSDSSMAQIPAEILGLDLPGGTLAGVLPELQRVYCGRIGFEFEHLSRPGEREWLRHAVESGEFTSPPTPEARRKVLAQLTATEAFETFLQRAYLGQTRFSIEGLDVLVPMLDLLVQLAASSGTKAVEIGMPHRGRLDVLTQVVGVPYADIFAQFQKPAAGEEGEVAPEGETSDVRYHIGAERQVESGGGSISVSVSPNPSHLEAIDPVVEGHTRADQTERRAPAGQAPESRGFEAAQDADRALAVLIHGDASFAAQGVVAETFNLARLAGYTTGGTIHVIANNQLGFTVEASEGRSTDYATDPARGFDVPVVHVNADDPDACLDAVRLAMAYRGRFRADFLIDVVGYRRHGHNEGDEPSYTQPLMYARIAEHPPIRKLYLDRLVAEGVVEDASAAAQELEETRAQLGGIRDQLEAQPSSPASDKAASPGRRSRRGSARRGKVAGPPATSVPAARLRAVNEALLAVPSAFTLHPKLAPQLQRRAEALDRDNSIAWAHAEALAFGSLLLDGVPIRLTGQDAVRGTFSQRHLELHDAANGSRYAPIQHLPGARASFELFDSPLSENACLAFEYGYSVADPAALVLWEAQYGDFANGAAVVIDQFVISGLTKWGQTSRLTLLLPHGYEGQGPDHSSARLERYLALGAENNMRVANCSTPAQYFHLLRDQALREEPRPLVLMTPKGLLRLPAASSSLRDLTDGAFEPVLDDPQRASSRDRVRRLVLCSGRLYYELIGSPQRKRDDVAVARVEMLYPFPTDRVADLLARYPSLDTVVWAQEEPWNMGARKFVMPELRELLPAHVSVEGVARPERSSPAEGHASAHAAEQARIVEDAMAGPSGPSERGRGSLRIIEGAAGPPSGHRRRASR